LVLAAQVVKLGLQIAAMVLLARLLTPLDFGLVAMVTALTGLVGLFAGLGLSQVIVQRAQITQAQLSTLFWLNLGFGLLLTLAVMLFAPLIAWVYHDPRLTGIALLGAPVYVIASAAVHYRALLLRQMRFRMLMLSDILGLTLSVLAGLMMAWWGAGYWSLVAMPVVQGAIQLLGLGLASDWRPGRPVRGCGVRPMLRFGGDLLGVTLFGYLARQIDKIGVGVLYGPVLLGYYSRGYQLFMLPSSQISTPLHEVIVPTLSRLTADPERFQRTFRRVLATLAWVSAGLALTALLWAPQIVGVVFGPQWDPVVTVLRNLSPTLALQPLLSSTGWAFISRGESGRYRRWALGSALIQGLAILAGLPLGIAGVALATSLCTWGLTMPWTLYCLRRADADLGRAALRAVAAPSLLVVTVLVVVLGTGRVP
jgi:PST family polysaccharide transporter